jgi:hypothetical protein
MRDNNTNLLTSATTRSRNIPVLSGSTSKVPSAFWRANHLVYVEHVLPSAETAAMLFWALLASGQITMRKVDGWESLATSLPIRSLTSPHDQLISLLEIAPKQIPTKIAIAPTAPVKWSASDE